MMKRFLFLTLLLSLAGADLLPAQAIMHNLPEHRETYANSEHVPEDAWGKSDPGVVVGPKAVVEAPKMERALLFPEIDQLEMAVYPNPTRNEASFRVALPSEKPIRLDLVDARGQLLRTIYENALQPKGELTQKLGLIGYPAGVYYLRMRIGEEMHSLPIVKQ